MNDPLVRWHHSLVADGCQCLALTWDEGRGHPAVAVWRTRRGIITQATVRRLAVVPARLPVTRGASDSARNHGFWPQRALIAGAWGWINTGFVFNTDRWPRARRADDKAVHDLIDSLTASYDLRHLRDAFVGAVMPPAHVRNPFLDAIGA